MRGVVACCRNRETWVGDVHNLSEPVYCVGLTVKPLGFRVFVHTGKYGNFLFPLILTAIYSGLDSCRYEVALLVKTQSWLLVG